MYEIIEVMDDPGAGNKERKQVEGRVEREKGEKCSRRKTGVAVTTRGRDPRPKEGMSGKDNEDLDEKASLTKTPSFPFSYNRIDEPLGLQTTERLKIVLILYRVSQTPLSPRSRKN